MGENALVGLDVEGKMVINTECEWVGCGFDINSRCSTHVCHFCWGLGGAFDNEVSLILFYPGDGTD